MTASKVKEQKKNPNIKTFKRIENWGLLITLMGIVIKLFVFDTYAEKMATTDRYMESYQKKELTSHINEIKAMLSPSYVSTERDYRILAEIMLHATQYFLIALDINEGTRIIKNLQAEGNMVTNNESYTAFK